MQLWQELLKARRTVSTGWTPPAGQIGWWYSAADVAAGGTWTDQSGNSHTATLVGNAAVTAGTGLALDGTGDWATVAGAFAGATAWTYAAWVKSAAVNVRVLGWNGYTDDWYLSVSGAGYKQGVYSGGFLYDSTVNALNAWVHLAVTWTTPNTLAYYVGGSLSSSVASGAALPTTLRLGASQFGETPFNGTLDDIQLYNVALSAPNIADLYANSPGSHAP